MISNDGSNMVMKYVMSIPLMTDREAIMEVKMSEVKNDEKGGVLAWCKTIDHPEYPA